MKILKGKNIECFAPDISMVLNEETLCDIKDFIKYALELRLSYVIFFFDNLMPLSQDGYFINSPEKYRDALKELIKIEKLLEGKFRVLYRIGCPEKELELLDNAADSYSVDKSKNEYKDLWNLAKDRSVLAESSMRRKLWEKIGRHLSYEEDMSIAFRLIKKGPLRVCHSVFHELMLTLRDGVIGATYCCKIGDHLLEIDKNTKGNVKDIINSDWFKLGRKEMLNGNFDRCKHARCPLLRQLQQNN